VKGRQSKKEIEEPLLEVEFNFGLEAGEVTDTSESIEYNLSFDEEDFNKNIGTFFERMSLERTLFQT
jgi:hypothetical protein